MNDQQECRYAHSIAIQRAHHALRAADEPLRVKLLEEFRSQIERLSRVKIYVACFSEAEDLLSQWRGYAGLGGYALGFSLENLRKLTSKQHFFISDVKYKFEEHSNELDPVVESILARYDANLSAPDDRQKIDEIFWPGMQAIAAKSAFIKHPSFSEEREWRLYSHPFSNSYDRNDFIVRNGQIVPILKFNLEDGQKETSGGRILKNVCFRTYGVGPGPDQDSRQEAIMAVIQRYKIYWHFGIRSEVPLRG